MKRLCVMCLASTLVSLSLHDTYAQTRNTEGTYADVEPSPATVQTSAGHMTYYRVVNNDDQLRIAPTCRFRLLDVNSPTPAIAEIGTRSRNESVVKLMIEGVPAYALAEAKRSLSKDKPVEVAPLTVTGLTVELKHEEYANRIAFKGYSVSSPTGLVNDVAATFEVPVTVSSESAQHFVTEVNEGKVTFVITYCFNGIKAAIAEKTLEAKRIVETLRSRKVVQGGSDLMTARQVADKTRNNVLQIVETSISINDDEELDGSSISVNDLVDMFSIGDYWKKEAKDVRDLEKRFFDELDLKIDFERFQPLTIQKHIISRLNESGSGETAYEDILKEAAKNKSEWSMAAKHTGKITGAYGYFTGKADHEIEGDYAKEIEKIKESSSINKGAFKRFVEKFHAVEYDDYELKYRGIQLCDFSNLNASSTTSIKKVRIRGRTAAGRAPVVTSPSTRKSMSEVFQETAAIRIPFHNDVAKRQITHMRVAGMYWGPYGPRCAIAHVREGENESHRPVTLSVVDPRNNRRLSPWSGLASIPQSLRVSSDGRQLMAITHVGRQRSASVINLKSGTALARYDSTDPVLIGGLSESYFLTLIGRNLSYRDRTTGNEIASVRNPYPKARFLHLGGETVALASEEGVYLMYLPSGKVRKVIEGYIDDDAEIAGSGSYLFLVEGGKRRISVIDMLAGSVRSTQIPFDFDHATALAVSADASTMVAVGNGRLLCWRRNEVDPRVIVLPDNVLSDFGVAVSPTGTQICIVYRSLLAVPEYIVHFDWLI